MSLASFAFSFPNYWTAKLSRFKGKRSKSVSIMARENFVAWTSGTSEYCLETSQQTGSGDVVWLQNNSEVHPEKSCYFFCLLSLSLQVACSAWTSSFLSVGTPVGAEELWKKQAVLSQWPSLATEVTWWAFAAAVTVRKTISQPSLDCGDSVMNTKERKLVKHKRAQIYQLIVKKTQKNGITFRAHVNLFCLFTF